MATTAYGVNNPLAQKLWSKILFVEALKATWFSKFMGEDSSSLAQIKTDTQKSRGDRITVGLRMQLTGAGIQGDNTLEGNEEALTTYNDNVYIDQLRHAVRTAGNMSQQRVPFDVREEAKNGLVDWWAGRLDTSFFNQLCGNTAVSDTRYTGNQATLAATTAQLAIAGSAFGTPESSLSASTVQYLKFTDIDRAVALAKTLTPMIRPLKVNGEDKYVMFVHPQTVLKLRADSSTAGNFMDLNKATLAGGLIANNPVYTGALGEYNGVILHEAFRVTNTITANTSNADQTPYRRNVFCGAQAALVAFGMGYGANAKPNWVEELFDYGNQLGVSGGMIFGIKKSVFNSADFGTLIISSYAPVP